MTDDATFDMLILNALADDSESISLIVDLIVKAPLSRDYLPHVVSEREVETLLRRLIADGLVQSSGHSSDDDEWFGLTDEGRRRWDAWIPPWEQLQQDQQPS